MEDSYSVRIPTYVDVSKKTTKAVNLNIYRNLHHHHLNKQKQNFHDEVKPLLRGKPRAEQIWIHYQIFAPRNGRLDTMNVGSIADKYFSDTLVEAGKIPDDNYDHIILSTFSFGGICPMDGHAIATVNILKKENQNMRVLLDEDDIQAALDAHVKSLNLPGATGVELSINNDGEIEAEVLMGDVKPKNKGGRPRGSKNKRTTASKAETQEDDADDVETDSEDSGDGTASGGSEPQKADSEEGEASSPNEEGGSKKSENPFSTEDSQSSESEETQNNQDTTTEQAEAGVLNGAAKPTPRKRPSIFDVD